MTFSSLKVSDYATWIVLPIYDAGSAAIAATTPHTCNLLFIKNGSGSNRVFRLNDGVPIPVLAGETISIDLRANGVAPPFVKITTDTATLTSLYAWGK